MGNQKISKRKNRRLLLLLLNQKNHIQLTGMLVLLLLQQSNHHKSLLQLTGQKNQQLPLIGVLNHSHTKLEPKNGVPNQCQQQAKTSGEHPPLPATGVPNQPVPLPIGELLLTQLVGIKTIVTEETRICIKTERKICSYCMTQKKKKKKNYFLTQKKKKKKKKKS